MSRSAWVTIGLIVSFALAFPAVAGAQGKPGGGGGGVSGSTTTGFDVSYPQCGTTLPTPAAFAVVGLNGGLANDLNPCLGPSSSYPSYTQSELYWAATAPVGGTGQPNSSLYVNTADPGNMYQGKPIADWPTSSTTDDPYGPCKTTTVSARGKTYTVGENSDACAWQYGYNMAAQDTAWLTSAADAINSQEATVSVPDSPGGYPWWLDVETVNSWQSDTTMNVADLQGMLAALQAASVTAVGAYSTSSQWSQVVGTTNIGSLSGIPDWIPGATSLAAAQANCSLPSFTNGTVAITQWTGTIDNDYDCTSAPSPTVPGAPTLTGTPANGVVSLSWTAPSDGGSSIEGYNIYRGTTAGGEAATPIATVTTGTTFSDTTVTNGTTYYYYVTAFNSVGASVDSNEVAATPQAAASLPPAPFLVGVPGKGKGVQLSWTETDGSVTSYNVYRSASGASGSFALLGSTTSTSYKDTKTSRNATYWYYVTAVNSAGPSAPSNTVSVAAA